MKRILIVEDNKRIREIVAFSLKNGGYYVDQAGDGETAVHFVDGDPYDLYIFDVMLPGMTGFELAEKVRQKNLESKILMLSAITQGTGVSDDDMKVKAKVDGFMSKPFKIKDLVEKVNDLLT